MKKSKFIISIFLLFAAFAQAQEKYEYMCIEFNYGLTTSMQISIDGKTYLEEQAVFLPGQRATHNANPFFAKVHEYERLGWEVMQFSTHEASGANYLIYFAYLRKKS